jgi:dihydroorotate dehydrogenase (NAD+) catalytic subunit
VPAPVDMTVAVGPIALSNPVVTASGTFGHGAEVARLGDPGAIGAVTAKSLSAEEWAGKPAPRLHTSAAGMMNAVGLQGQASKCGCATTCPRCGRSARA